MHHTNSSIETDIEAFVQLCLRSKQDRNLRNPKFHPHSELPEYLSESELRRLHEYAARNWPQRNFAIISPTAEV